MAEQILPEELIEQVSEIATAQNRQPSEVVEEAVCKYVTAQRLARFADRIGAKAASMGITETDVLGLVAETRTENKTRAR